MAPNKSNKRQLITLDTKLDIIKRFDNGESKANIGRALGFGESTVRAVLNKATEYREQGKVASASLSMQCTRNRSPLMIEMEDLLFLWLEDCNQKRIPVDSNKLRFKALSLFSTLKENKYQGVTVTFSASKGWLENFKNRTGIKNVKLTGEAVSADKDAVARYPAELKKIIEENGYDHRQIFNVDETGLFWKKMPTKTSLARKEATTPGYKVSKDRLTLLLGGNAEGDFKLKPMLIYRTMNPRAFKGCNKQALPVIWKSNKKAWVTPQLFEEWLTSHFCPEVEKYCKENNIPFKVLLILDTAPGHPASLNNLNSNVRVVFLPPNMASLMQPMDQGVISAFKAYYIRRIFAQATQTTTGDNPITLEEFWKKFDIKQAVTNIHESWKEVTASCMKTVWQNLLPECANNFGVFINPVNKVIDDIVTFGKALGFEDVDSENVQELLESHAKDLSNEDLLGIEHQQAYEEKETEEVENMSEEITVKELEELFRTIEKAKELILEIDPNVERSMNVRRGLDKQIDCYRKIMEEKKKANAFQLTLDKFLREK